MVELDGQRRTPDFFVPYVSFIILGTILTPLAAVGLLIKDGEADLGLSTLGVYLLCLIVQIATESFTLRTGVCPTVVLSDDIRWVKNLRTLCATDCWATTHPHCNTSC